MDDLENRLKGLVKPIAAGHRCELVEARIRRGKRTAFVTLFLDTAHGEPSDDERARAARPFDASAEPAPAPYEGSTVSVDTCASVSSEIGAVIDAENLLPGRYVLEVSSPGIERPLVHWQDYVRFRGQPVDAKFADGAGGTRRLRGLLAAARKDDFLLIPEAGQALPAGSSGGIWIRFDRVLSARLVYREPASGKRAGGRQHGRGAR